MVYPVEEDSEEEAGERVTETSPGKVLGFVVTMQM